MLIRIEKLPDGNKNVIEYDINGKPFRIQKLNGANQLHCTYGPAIIIKDGQNEYAIEGVKLSKSEWIDATIAIAEGKKPKFQQKTVALRNPQLAI